METGITVIVYLQTGMDTDLAAFRKNLEGPEMMHAKSSETIIVTVADTGNQVGRQASARIEAIVHIAHMKAGIRADIEAGDGPQTRDG